MNLDELKEKYQVKLQKMNVSDWDLMYPVHENYSLCKEIIDDLNNVKMSSMIKSLPLHYRMCNVECCATCDHGVERVQYVNNKVHTVIIVCKLYGIVDLMGVCSSYERVD